MQVWCVLEDLDITCRTFAEASSADWSAKERCEKLLTRNIRAIGFKLRQRLAIGQNRNVTCESFGTFAEASSADWSVKEGCEKVLTRSIRTAGIKLLKLLAIGQNRNVACESFGTFAEASSADRSAKEGCRNVRIVVVLLPSSELMFDKSMWVMSAISLKLSASTKRPQSSRFTTVWPGLRRILLMIRMTSPVKVPVGCNRNIRGSIISGLVRKRSVWETFYR